MGKFIDNWEPPRLEEKEHSYGWLWLILLFVAIGLVVLFLMQQKTGTTPTQIVQETNAPSTGDSESSTSGSGQSAQANVAASNAPEMNDKCVVAGTSTGPTVGIVPGTVVRDGNKVSVTFKNSGKVAIDSSYFEFADLTGKVTTGEVVGKAIYKQNNDAIAIGETKTYVVDLDEVSQELGASLYAFSIYPAVDGKACVNAKQFVIRYEG